MTSARNLQISPRRGPNRIVWLVLAIAALVVGLALASTQLRASPPPTLVAARAQFASCIRSQTAKYLVNPALTTKGVALFVGAACAGDREAYRKAMIAAGLPDTATLIDRIDTQAVAYIVASTASRSP